MLKKKRRRAFRASTAGDYDRTADSPTSQSVGDETRDVILDPEQDDMPSGEEFWKEQKPPHHG
ncbi:MAG: hypothetical protein GX898_10980 [Corynebacterium sp.]|uniref:hypothetical protein n=1 Tax=uncultured Corynebacterium sp. TaxID=159447 RepID=UPI0017A01210|nr:hypothetical protein [uncultured Corynebacterium sp.]NLZ58797.1 hypothetical protein [Corynebacterium sp.]